MGQCGEGGAPSPHTPPPPSPPPPDPSSAASLTHGPPVFEEQGGQFCDVDWILFSGALGEMSSPASGRVRGFQDHTNKQCALHVSHGLCAFQSLNGSLQNCYFWPSLGKGTAREAITLPFIFFIALIFSQQLCVSFILGGGDFHFKKITVNPPKTEAGKTSLSQGDALRLCGFCPMGPGSLWLNQPAQGQLTRESPCEMIGPSAAHIG